MSVTYDEDEEEGSPDFVDKCVDYFLKCNLVKRVGKKITASHIVRNAMLNVKVASEKDIYWIINYTYRRKLEEEFKSLQIKDKSKYPIDQEGPNIIELLNRKLDIGRMNDQALH